MRFHAGAALIHPFVHCRCFFFFTCNRAYSGVDLFVFFFSSSFFRVLLADGEARPLSQLVSVNSPAHKSEGISAQPVNKTLFHLHSVGETATVALVWRLCRLITGLKAVFRDRISLGAAHLSRRGPRAGSQCCQGGGGGSIKTLSPAPPSARVSASWDWRGIYEDKLTLLFRWPSSRIGLRCFYWHSLHFNRLSLGAGKAALVSSTLWLFSLGEGDWAAGDPSMARPLLKIQRYFRRKPIRFFSLILLYLTAGSLVFLHSGFVGDSGPGTGGGSRDTVVAPETGSRASVSDSRGLGIMNRVFKETRRSGRRYGTSWMKKAPQEGHEGVRRGGDYTRNWNRALKGRNAKDMDEGRGE